MFTDVSVPSRPLSACRWLGGRTPTAFHVPAEPTPAYELDGTLAPSPKSTLKDCAPAWEEIRTNMRAGARAHRILMRTLLLRCAGKERGDGAPRLHLPSHEAFREEHVLATPDVQGNPLVKLRRLHVEHRPLAGRRVSARLLRDERERIGL